METKTPHDKIHRKINIAIGVGIIIVIVACYFLFRKEKEKPFTVGDYVRLKTEPLKVIVTKEYHITPEMTEGIYYYEDQTITWFTNTIAETDSTPNNTASGEIVCVGIVAPSQDFYGVEIRNGDLVLVVKADIWLEARCTMNQRKSDQFDVFFYKEQIPMLEIHPLWGKPFTSDIYVIRLKQRYPYKRLFRVKGDREEAEIVLIERFYKFVQKKLKAKKFYSGKIDGVIGSGTIKSIKGFQKANKLTINGIVDSKTFEKLIKKERKK